MQRLIAYTSKNTISSIFFFFFYKITVRIYVGTFLHSICLLCCFLGIWLLTQSASAMQARFSGSTSRPKDTGRVQVRQRLTACCRQDNEVTISPSSCAPLSIDFGLVCVVTCLVYYLRAKQIRRTVGRTDGPFIRARQQLISERGKQASLGYRRGWQRRCIY